MSRRKHTSKKKHGRPRQGGPRAEVPLLRLPQDLAAWEGDTLPLAKLMEALPLPPSLGAAAVPPADALLWVDAANGTPVGVSLVPSDEAAEALAALLLESMRHPEFGPPRRPRSVRLRDATLAEAVRPRAAEAGVRVEVVETLPVWDAVSSSLHELFDLGDSPAPTNPLASDTLPLPLKERLFRAAADYYAAAPWRVLDDTPVELHLPGHDRPVLASVLGAGGMEHGLVLHFSAADLLRLLESEALPEVFPDALALTYEPESEVEEALRAERRRHKWKLAGPAAFPRPMRTRPPAETLDPTPEEIELLCLAADAVREIVRRYGRRLRGGEPLEEAIPLQRADGSDATARIVYPAPLPDVAQTMADGRETERERALSRLGLAPTPSGEGGNTPLLAELRDRIARLPDSGAVLHRLAWSFFHRPSPDHLPDDSELAREQAMGRFLDWALFLMPLPPLGFTLAEQALDAADDLDDEAYDERDRFSHPLWDVWQVEKVRRGEGLTLRGLIAEQRVRVRERLASHQVEQGWSLFGAVFPLADGDWVLGAMTPLAAALPRAAQEQLRDVDPADAAPLLERTLFGANFDWIEELEGRAEVKAFWEALREALDNEPYTWATLERKIREAQSPAEVLVALQERIQPWTPAEAQVLSGLLVVAWQVTSRRELDGLSPREYGAREGGAGPTEQRLLRQMSRAALTGLHDENYPSHAGLEAEMHRRMRAWLTTPHPEHGGRTPEQVILEERRFRGTTERWPGVDALVRGLRLLGSAEPSEPDR